MLIERMMEMTSDNQLILSIINGNTDAYSILMNQYHDEIYKYVYNIIGDVDHSDDVVQEIFIRVYKKLKTYDSSKAGFRTWLYRVSHNHTMNFLKSYNKKRSMELSNEQTDLLASNENIEAKLVKEEQLNRVIQAIETVLKQKAKKIIYLHYFSELSPKEISEVTGIPVQTVYKSIQSSIEKIRKEVLHNGKNE